MDPAGPTIDNDLPTGYTFTFGLLDELKELGLDDDSDEVEIDDDDEDVG